MEGGNPEAFVSRFSGVVIHLCRIFGVAPLTMSRVDKGWIVRQSIFFGVYGWVVVSVANILTTITIVMDMNSEPGKSVRMRTSPRRIVWTLDASVMMAIAVMGTAGAPSRMRSLIRCLNRLEQINTQLTFHQNGGEIWKYFLLFLWAGFVTLITVTDIQLLASILRDDNAMWIQLAMMYSAYYLCYGVMQMFIAQFVLLTLYILRSFKAVNGTMKKLIKGSQVVPNKLMERHTFAFTIMNKKSVNKVIDSLAVIGNIDDSKMAAHESVRRLSRTYVSLCGIVREVDRLNGPMLLLLLGSFLIHLVITPYNLISNIFENKEQRLNIILQIAWCIFHTANMVLVIEPCHQTIEEMVVTREMISRLMDVTSSLDGPLAMELELFFRQVILNQATYSPLKVTTLTRSLVATILGSITTYLVIIIDL